MIDEPAFPREHVPKHPLVSPACFRGGSSGATPCVLDAGAARFVTRGGFAIALALEQLQVRSGDQILVPAYHCVAMIDPVIWAGATPVFYRINPDTSVDLEDIRAKIGASTRAILVPHYFGFGQPIAEIRRLCDTRHIALIEDCAHAFFGTIDGCPVGSHGDYAIASPWKFFPIPEGGCIVSRRHDLTHLKLQPPGAMFHAKSLVNLLENAFEYGRMPMLRFTVSPLLALKDRTWGMLKRARRSEPSRQSTQPEDARPDPGMAPFDGAWVHRSISLASRLVIARASRRRIVERRRVNYLKFLAALSDIPGGQPLHRTMPEGCVPQVFPFVMGDPGRMFPRLRMAGVPIIRFGEYLWPGVDGSVCHNSVELSRRVFQFPCHQELRDGEVDWMITEIVRALHEDSYTRRSVRA